MQFFIHKQVPTRVPKQELTRLFDVVVGAEARKSWHAGINLVFTDDRRIRLLNEEYRGKDKATDVLSFVLDEPEPASNVFGEIYISVATAARQARELGHSVKNEYLRLTCHGLMHLFGYDHQEDREAEKMEARERKYLRKVGGAAL